MKGEIVRSGAAQLSVLQGQEESLLQGVSQMTRGKQILYG